MSDQQTLWVLRTSQGQLKGPFSTEKVKSLILDGTFTGTEFISKYPEGSWGELLKRSEFYDALMSALEEPVKPDTQYENKVSAETVVGQLNDEGGIDIKEEEIPTAGGLGSEKKAKRTFGVEDSLKSQTTDDESKKNGLLGSQLHKDPMALAPKSFSLPNKSPTTPSSILPENLSHEEDIELEEGTKAQPKALLNAAAMIIGSLVLGYVLFTTLFFPNRESRSAAISLVMPKKPQNIYGKEKVEQELGKAFSTYMRGGLGALVQAQNNLVNIVENEAYRADTRSLLCLVYKELWPFTDQSLKNLKAVAVVMQQARSIDPSSPHTKFCEVVLLMVSSRTKEAKGLIENTLENLGGVKFSMNAAMYYLKGEILEQELSLDNAFAYYEFASRMWPEWVESAIAEARILFKKQKYNEAGDALKRALEKNTQSTSAKIWIGIVSQKGYNKPEQAIQFFKEAFSLKDRVPATLEAQGRFYYAEALLATLNNREATAQAERALRLNPMNAEYKNLVLRLGGNSSVEGQSMNSMLIVGDQYMNSGEYLAAQAEYKAAFELNPRNAMAAYRAAKCLWKLNQSQEAVEWLNKAIKSDENFIAAYLQKAEYLAESFDFVGASAALALAQKKEPNSYEVQKGFAKLELKKLNPQGAIAFANKAIAKYDGDVELFILLAEAYMIQAQAITVDPNKPKEVETRSQYLLEAKKYSTRSVEIEPANPDAQIIYAKFTALSQGVDIGISYLNDVIKKFPYSMVYRLNLAEMNKSVERYSEAASIYSQIIELEPKNKEAYMGLAQCERAMGDMQKALQNYLKASMQDPSDAEPIDQAAQLLIEMNKYDDAERQIRRVIMINPNYPRIYYQLARVHFARGNFSEAISSAKKEKEQNPRVADSYILTAEVLFANKQYAECAAEYSLAIKLRPQSADMYVKAAQCYRLADSLDVAEDMLSLAQSRESGYAEIYREQGAIYEKKGDVRSAIKAYDTYLELSPNAPDKSEVQFRLRKLGG